MMSVRGIWAKSNQRREGIGLCAQFLIDLQHMSGDILLRDTFMNHLAETSHCGVVYPGAGSHLFFLFLVLAGANLVHAYRAEHIGRCGSALH